MGGVLEGVCVELAVEVQVNISGGGAACFLGVGAYIQKLKCSDSLSCRRHRVRVDFREIRPVSVTDQVAIYLKYIFHWGVRIIKPMLYMQRGAELSKLVLEECSAGVSHVASPDISLRSTEITHEIISEGGWQCVHEPAD